MSLQILGGTTHSITYLRSGEQSHLLLISNSDGGLLIFGNGAGGNSIGAALNPIYQRFGELHDFAVIGTGFWNNFSSSSELSIWDNHLAALATASGALVRLASHSAKVQPLGR